MDPKILLADDHIMVSKGLRLSLQLDFGYKEVNSVTSCNEIMRELSKKTYTHLVLDIGLTDGSALEIIPAIKVLYPLVKILIFSGKPAAAYKKALTQYGVHNYLSKEEAEDDTVTALRQFFSAEKVSMNHKTGDNPFSGLSAREMEILHYVMKGMGSTEIANELNVKKTTISTFKARIFDKTHTKNIKELLDLAMVYNIG